MKTQKCSDCITRFSISKTIGLCMTFAGFAFGIGKVYTRFETVEQDAKQARVERKEITKKLDFLIVNSKREYNPNVVYSDSFVIGDNVICQKDEDEKKKRIAYESTFDFLHFEEAE